MFTELVITIGGRQAVFKAHEIVRIAQNITETYALSAPSDQVILPSVELYNALITEMLSKLTKLEIIAGAIDNYIMVPMHIGGLDSTLKWLSIAKKLNVQHSKKKNRLMECTWVEIAGRLLIIKNTEEMLFYVRDHGGIGDIIQKIRNLVFDFEWTNSQLMYMIIQIHKKLESMAPEAKQKFKNDLIESFKSGDIQVLRGFNLALSDEEIEQMLDNSINNQIELFLNIEESNGYAIFVLVKKYMQMKKALNNFDNKLFHNFYVYNEAGEAIKKPMKIGGIVRSWEERFFDAHKFIKILVLQQLARDVNTGLHEPLFRPILSYGERAHTIYHALELSFADYFTKAERASEVELAFTIRQILCGQSPDLSDCSFVASLVGAWFIAEPARNLVSFLSGLMLLDMIENNVLLLDNHGNNWYSWRNVLIHPFKGAGRKREKEARDLYGTKVKNIDRDFGGAHPMVHTGLADEASEIEEKTALTAVHQKEASLFLHWLKLYLDKEGIESQLVSAAEKKLNPSDVIFNWVSGHSSEHLGMIQLDKKIADLKKAISTKVKKGRPTNDDEEKLKTLQSEKEELELKRKIQVKIIVPALKKRLESLDKQDFRIIGWSAVQNFLPSVVVNHIVHEYLGFKGTRSSFVSNVLAASNIHGHAAYIKDGSKKSVSAHNDPSFSADVGITVCKKGHGSKYLFIEDLFTKLLRFVSKNLAAFDRLPPICGYEDVPGDGLCFYHAIARQLDVVDSNDSREDQQRVAKALQELAINEVLNNLSIYEAFVAQHGGLNGFFDYHLQRQTSNDGGWADNIMIQALANALGHRIEIQLFNLQGEPIGFAPLVVPRNDPHAPILMLGNIANLHFVAATRDNNLRQQEENKVEEDTQAATGVAGEGSIDSNDKAPSDGGKKCDKSTVLYEEQHYSIPNNAPTAAPTVIVLESASVPNATVYYEALEFSDTLMLSGIDSVVSNHD